LSLAVHRAPETHCFWVGDSPVYETVVLDGDYVTRLVSRPDSGSARHVITDWFGGTSPFQLKRVHLSTETSIVTITSDGAVHDADMLNDAYRRHGFSESVAEEVQNEALGNPAADDVSIVAMKIPRS